MRAVERALLTSNFEKSLKKNETDLDFCTSVRSNGLVGLSPPVPPSIAHHFPEQRGAGVVEASAAHNRRAGVAACGEAACVQVRAPVLMPPWKLRLCMSTLVVTGAPPPEEMTPGPLETA